jgi:hypothetical protein
LIGKPLETGVGRQLNMSDEKKVLATGVTGCITALLFPVFESDMRCFCRTLKSLPSFRRITKGEGDGTSD